MQRKSNGNSKKRGLSPFTEAKLLLKRSKEELEEVIEENEENPEGGKQKSLGHKRQPLQKQVDSESQQDAQQKKQSAIDDIFSKFAYTPKMKSG